MAVVRTIWKVMVGIKDGLVLLLMLLFFGLLFAALSSRPNLSIPSGGALLVDLDGTVVEQPAQARPLAVLAGGTPVIHQTRLRDLVRAIRAAGTDARVKAVVLDLDGFRGAGQTARTDVGAALDTVRRAGKPVLAFATGYDDASYQIAAHAGEVWLDPLGPVAVAGPGGTLLFYKALLDRIGVNAHVYRVGTYKSAVEPFTRTSFSPEAKQDNQALLDALWAAWRRDVLRVRPQARLAGYIADPVNAARAAGGDPARAALDAHLVDRIGDRSAFGRRVAALVGTGDAGKNQNFKTIALDDWIAANPAKTAGDGIGVVTVAGDIIDGRSTPGAANAQDIAERLRRALAKKTLKALVVRIDSPGGSVTGSEAIRAAIVEAKRQHLPVVVSMGSVAASGGYWIASAGDRILAEPSTVTGSIGVFAIIPTFETTLAKLGIGTDGVHATPYSGQPDVYAGTNRQVDALLQLGVESMYGRFTGLVAVARHKTPVQVDAIGQGRVWDGIAAQRIGLIDGFGTLDDAVAQAAWLAKLDPAKVHPVYIERQPGLLGQLLTGFASSDSGSDARDGWASSATRPDELLAQAMGDARAVLGGPVIQARCLVCTATMPPAPLDRARAHDLLSWLGLR